MLFAYIEDGRLEVVTDVAEARRQFAGPDVEAGVVRLFDEAGNPLAAQFPHRTERKVLGIRVSSDPGPFELVPAGAADEKLADAFGPTVVLMPNPWFKDLDALRAHLTVS